MTFDYSESPDVQCLYKVNSPIGVIVSRSHPLAVRQSVTMLECAESPRISSNNATADKEFAINTRQLSPQEAQGLR